MLIYNAASDVSQPQDHHRLEHIPAHDPFVLADANTQTYYLYTGGMPDLHGMDRYGVLLYKSNDLERWAGPYIVFEIPDTSWAHPQHGAWAPEVHAYKGRYYLFVTLHHEGRSLEGEPIQGYTKHWRSTVIAVSDTPEGPFELLHEEHPLLPETMMTLDGTLYIDEQQQPWLVYCHEWVQTIDGTIEAIRLQEDLSAVVGEPITLFSGSAAPWLSSISARQATTATESAQLQPEPQVYVTDGCQLYRTSGGTLMMLWSSYEHGSYVQTIARSISGKLAGPWEQLDPLVRDDSGHGMLFRTFDGRWKLILHRPFRIPESRCWLFEVEDVGDRFRLAQ
ncbi:glycoside hydrolase family 43 protein [Paenibacillus campi]|uniref:glycoside hydrolase family 43 protein n=1 Tax=Paenibacillus campi TaxID=3106031 RepID=UPI002AFFE393|nr:MULTISPECIES: glycoside hydrolase family 43 protein [unclassified Paenibacillus]